MRLIYLSPVLWQSYAQRPHFLVRHFLWHGGKEVLWINPYPGRLPRVADLFRPIGLHEQGTKLDPRVIITDFAVLPLEPLPGGYRFNKEFFGAGLFQKIADFISLDDCILGIGKPSALAVDLLENYSFWSSFNDAMDDFPMFHHGISRQAMASRECQIIGLVDNVLVSSTELLEKFSVQHRSVNLVHNACDPDALPLNRKNKRQQRVLGYIGSVGEWFDWNLVQAIARHCPSSEIRLIGPQLVPPPKNLPNNIKIFPACRHDRIGPCLNDFDVGLIPFIKSPLTQSVDPIKYYEYRALGLPILTTNFGEMRYRRGAPGVFFTDEEGGLQATIESAIHYSTSPDDISAWRREHSWTARFTGANVFSDVPFT